jgi:PAS domain S-box-containing protein
LAANSLTSITALKATRVFGTLESTLLNTVEQAVIATDLEGRIIFWNRFAERLYGWRDDEVLGQNILEVTPNAESRASAEIIFAQLKKGESWSGEFTVRDKSGRWFSCLHHGHAHS